MGRKTPISFNLRKYVEEHCNQPVVSAQQNKKTRRTTTQTTLFLILLTSLTEKQEILAIV